MEKLSETAERVWKIIAQSPEGKATAKYIMRITGLKHSRAYKCLKELEHKEIVEHQQPYWILKAEAKNKERELIIELPPLNEDERETEARLKSLLEVFPELTFLRTYLNAKKDLRIIRLKSKK
jgi:hypothetical protein